ncbi:hypothetical protein [Flavobacterium beibuense]|uniref:Lipoprotein n=1 Tax=Flavobacterium beibuense TaxID=657326 RepID=A0A444WDU9_9FLAO|nr:hypothetical protein [Flavobacterium beibuense]RYJ43952.1 hypothetical protein NU09_1460 [Flavobacterium beibuense]
MKNMFHVERYNKTLFYKGFFLFLLSTVILSCSAPRYAVDVSDYVLLEDGKHVMGTEKGLTAFLFQNQPTKITFNQFLVEKYDLGKFTEIEYWTTVEGTKFKMMLYTQDELNKYFDTTDFIASNRVPENAVVGSQVKFLAISVINEFNEDCLADDSLFKNTVIKYLKDLKDQYNNL